MLKKKGSFGYLQGKRTFSIIKSALFLAAVLLIYFLALRHYHTNKNIFSLLAAVGALPTGRSIVESIMCMRAKGATGAVRDRIEKVPGMPLAASGYDLYLTSYERAFSVSHLAAADHTVLGLVEDPGTDAPLCVRHIEQMLEKDGKEGYQVQICSDPDEYIRALTGLCAAAGQEPPDQLEEDLAVRNLLLAISL